MLHRIRVSTAALAAALLLIASLLAPPAVTAAASTPAAMVGPVGWFDSLWERLASWLSELGIAQGGETPESPIEPASWKAWEVSPDGSPKLDIGDSDPDALPGPGPQAGGDMDPDG